MASNELSVERRVNLGLRSVFDTIYVQIEPFFDPANSWGGHSLEHLAYRVVREAHPELSNDDVHQLVIAAARVYRSKHPDAHHVPHPDELRGKLFK